MYIVVLLHTRKCISWYYYTHANVYRGTITHTLTYSISWYYYTHANVYRGTTTHTLMYIVVLLPLLPLLRHIYTPERHICIQGVSEKNGTKFAAPHFCNHMSQSHAVFNKNVNTAQHRKYVSDKLT